MLAKHFIFKFFAGNIDLKIIENTENCKNKIKQIICYANKKNKIPKIYCF